MRVKPPPYRGRVDRRGLMIGMMVYLRDLNMVDSMYGAAKRPDSFVLNATDGGRWRVSLKRMR